MAITTYSELQTAAANWLNRSDLTDRIVEFIDLAEARFNRELDHHRMVIRSTATMSAEYTDLPDDFIEPISMRLVKTPPVELEAISVERAVELRQSTTGIPYYYAIVEDTIQAIPAPNQSFTVEMIYKAKIPALTDSNTSNWLLSFAPDVYLFGTLVEAQAYIMDDERVPLWEAKLTQALEDLRMQGTRVRVGGTQSMRINPF